MSSAAGEGPELRCDSDGLEEIATWVLLRLRSLQTVVLPMGILQMAAVYLAVEFLRGPWPLVWQFLFVLGGGLLLGLVLARHSIR